MQEQSIPTPRELRLAAEERQREERREAAARRLEVERGRLRENERALTRLEEEMRETDAALSAIVREYEAVREKRDEALARRRGLSERINALRPALHRLRHRVEELRREAGDG